jgi:UrcA family protein
VHQQPQTNFNPTRREKTMMTATSKFSEYWHGAMITTVSACMLAGLVQVARAAEPAPSITVAYGDLNLATAQGANTLYARIVDAARTVCGADRVDIRELRALGEARSCESNAIAQAVQAVHHPAQAALAGTRQPQG